MPSPENHPGPHGLYVHIPFCARRCDYCDFFVVAGSLAAETFRAYADSLLREAEAAARALPAMGVLDTIYLGGGTPSFAPPAEIARLREGLAESFAIAPGAEITLEANPESVTPGAAAAWRGAGINRLSLGAQSFDDAVLAPRGRLHTAEGTERAVRAAREAGFGNIGIDLIAGLPGESPRGFTRGVERAIALGPEHVSVYLLETEESGKLTPLSRALREGRARAVEEAASVEMYESAVRLLTGAGYGHYEISNFARPGMPSRHNLKYWLSSPWIGLGPSAHSHTGGRRRENPADLAAWQRQVERGETGRDYTLPDAAARAREALVMELRLLDGVDTAGFARRWGMDPDADLAQTLDELRDAGLLRRQAGRVALTPRGVLLSNEVFGRIA